MVAADRRVLPYSVQVGSLVVQPDPNRPEALTGFAPAVSGHLKACRADEQLQAGPTARGCPHLDCPPAGQRARRVHRLLRRFRTSKP